MQVPLFKFRQCQDYSEQSNPYLSLRLLHGKDVYFNVSILTLFSLSICIVFGECLATFSF